MITQTDVVLVALRCLFSEHPQTQGFGPERFARLLWLHGWIHWPPPAGDVEMAGGPRRRDRGGVMLSLVLALTALNTLLQLVAVYQRHVSIQHQKRNGAG